MSDQLAGPPGAQFFVVVVSAAALPVPKYTKEDLQHIFKTVLEAQAPTISEEPWNKLLKACFLDVYCGKFHIKCYNFCQQCEDYFTNVGAREANQILFAVSSLQDQITFHWQQYKRKQNANSAALVT